jgi:xanthine dehydrogenase YagT iron-sulfur-binding subunit
MSKVDDEAVREGVSRRDFLKIGGLSAAIPLVHGPKMIQAGGAQVPVHGPGPVPISLSVNGKRLNAQLEPRVTLLDALREQFDITGPKRVCDRGECGACTVLLDGKAVYSCTTLAIEAQGRQVTTCEGLMAGEQPHPVQQAYVDNDAQQCGFCTPGFVVATKAFLDKHPNPTPEQLRTGLAGNFCRCGTYFGIRHAVAQVASGRRGGATHA